jgi:Uma2 family endonuclease
MATVATKPMTADEFFGWVHQPENRDRYFELERGGIIEMPPPGKYHGFVCANVSRILGNFAAARRKGYVCTNDSGVLVERDPDTVWGVDVTFYDDAENADDMERKYAVEPPLLAVEVMSPGDRINRTLVRVTQLLNVGVKQVWVIDPQARDMSIYRQGKNPEMVQADGELTAGDILPDFRCHVNEFFGAPGASH